MSDRTLTKAAGTSDVQNSTDGSLEHRASKENQKEVKFKGKPCLAHATSSPTAQRQGQGEHEAKVGDMPYKAKCRQVIMIIVGTLPRARTELSQNMNTMSKRTRPTSYAQCSFLILDK